MTRIVWFDALYKLDHEVNIIEPARADKTIGEPLGSGDDLNKISRELESM